MLSSDEETGGGEALWLVQIIKLVSGWTEIWPRVLDSTSSSPSAILRWFMSSPTPRLMHLRTHLFSCHSFARSLVLPRKNSTLADKALPSQAWLLLLCPSAPAWTLSTMYTAPLCSHLRVLFTPFFQSGSPLFSHPYLLPEPCCGLIREPGCFPASSRKPHLATPSHSYPQALHPVLESNLEPEVKPGAEIHLCRLKTMPSG